VSIQTSPYRRDPYWLDQRRDGRSKFWQITRSERGVPVYRSTRKTELTDAIAVMDAWIDAQKSLEPQKADEAGVAAMMVNYWQEKASKAVNHDQAGRSLRTFLAFMLADRVGVHAVLTDLTPTLFERFREWRMGPHSFSIEWFGELYEYASEGVSGATVQRNINDVRAAVHHAERNLRIPAAPRIPDIDPRYRSRPRDRVLTVEEMARILWYSCHSPDLFRFVVLQMMTSVRPQAALAFDPGTQYDARSGLIDTQPDALPQTKKRNAIIPAVRPLKPILAAWASDGAAPVGSRKTAWRIMRRTLGLSDDVFPKTIRHTIATWLYEMEWVPERQISEMLGHADETGLSRTSRIYAKYRPDRMGKVVKGLTIIWMRVSRAARAYASDHILTTIGQGGELKVCKIGEKEYHSLCVRNGGRDRD